jgi:hypothetical protein
MIMTTRQNSYGRPMDLLIVEVVIIHSWRGGAISVLYVATKLVKSNL